MSSVHTAMGMRANIKNVSLQDGMAEFDITSRFHVSLVATLFLVLTSRICCAGHKTLLSYL